MSETTTEQTATVLDLDHLVTRQQYEASLNGIMTELNTYRRQTGYCDQFWGHAARVHPSFQMSTRRDPADRNGYRLGHVVLEPEADTWLTREDLTETGWQRLTERRGSAYARELREVRGRILAHVNGNGTGYTISLEWANRLLAAGNLPQFTVEEPEGTRYQVTFAFSVHLRDTAEDDREAATAIRAKIRDALTAMGVEEDGDTLARRVRNNTGIGKDPLVPQIPADQLAALL